MLSISRFLQRTSLMKLRVNLSSTADTSSTSSETASPAKEEEYYLDMTKFVRSIGIDARTSNEKKSFARMLRESKLMQLGDIRGKVVTGKIVHRMQDDVYIDVGLKFNAVCKAPSDDFRVGSLVLVQLLDAELSEKFLGSKKDITLLEADAKLLRLLKSRSKSETKFTKQAHPRPETKHNQGEQVEVAS